MPTANPEGKRAAQRLMGQIKHYWALRGCTLRVGDGRDIWLVKQSGYSSENGTSVVALWSIRSNMIGGLPKDYHGGRTIPARFRTADTWQSYNANELT